jgi:1,4-dihydroxy-2-naphthoate polyprenyltransferase
MTIHRSTIQLLRFPFSVFLLPVYLFAVSQVEKIDVPGLILSFLILHLLVYPASNGYNSYMDRDESSIGGVKNPMQPTKQLFHATLLMDALAVLLSLAVSVYFSMGILLYILVSRAYSYRGIRLKKYPILGYLSVVIFQGAVTFAISYHACSVGHPMQVPLLPALASSLLIGGFYPLTQVYQHEADKADGVHTISRMPAIAALLYSVPCFILLRCSRFFCILQKEGKRPDSLSSQPSCFPCCSISYGGQEKCGMIILPPIFPIP